MDSNKTLEEKLEDFTNRYGDEWTEDSFEAWKSILRSDKELATDIATEYGSYARNFSLIEELYELMKDVDEEIAQDLALENDINIPDNEKQKIIDEYRYSRIKNKYINAYRESSLLKDDIFENMFGSLDGKEAIRRINEYDNIELKKKIFERYESEIIKRFSVAGKEESANMKGLIELNILSEKDLRRALKRILKMNSYHFPIEQVYNNDIFSNEEVIDFAKEKGISNIDYNEDTPGYLVDYAVENLEESRVLRDIFKKCKLSSDQRITCLNKMEIDDLGSSYKNSTEKEKKYLRDYLMKNYSKIKGSYSNLSNEDIENIAQDDLYVGLFLLDKEIEDRYNSIDYLNCNIITGELVYKIFEENMKSALRIVKNEIAIPKLKEASLDEKFVTEALKSIPKKEVKEFSSYVLDYLGEKEREKIESEAVKSVDGAIDVFEKKSNNEKLRKKALAKVASSENAIMTVVRNDLLTDEEYEKMITYKKAAEIINSGYRHQEGGYKDKIMLKLSKSSLDSLFNQKSIFIWSQEAINRVDIEKKKEVIKALVSDENFINTHNFISLLDVKDELFAGTIIKNSSKEAKNIILSEPESYTGKKYLKEIKPSEVSKKYRFVVEKTPGEEDLKGALKYFKNLINGEEEEDFPLVQIKNNQEKFFLKWSDSHRRVLMEKYFNLRGLKIGVITNFDELRDLAFEVLKGILDNPEELLFFLERNRPNYFENFKNQEKEWIFNKAKEDEENLSYFISKYGGYTKDLYDIDEIVSKIVEGEIEPRSVPENIGKSLALQGVRQRNHNLISLASTSIGSDYICDLVGNDEEAKAVYSSITNYENKKYQRYYFRNSLLDNKFKILKKLIDFNLKDEVTESIIEKSEERGRVNVTEYVRMFEGKYSDSLVEKLFEKVNSKAEIKRMVEEFSRQGYENKVSLILNMDLDKYSGIFTKKFLKERMNSSVLLKILEGSPRRDDLDSVLNYTEDPIVIDEVIKKAIDYHYLNLIQKEDYFYAHLNNKEIFKYNIIIKKVETKGTDKYDKLIKDFLKVYVDLVNTSGIVDFSTKTITKSSGEKFDLSSHDVVYEAEEESKMNEIEGLIAFGIPVKARARIFLSNSSRIICRVELLEEEVKKEKNEDLEKIQAQIERKIEDIETDFINILGKLNKDHPYGVEMEFSSRLKRSTISDKLNNEISDEGFNSIGIDAYRDTTGNSWEIKYDGSIKTGKGGFSAEVVSPKLYGEEGLKQLEKVVTEISKLGGRVKTGVEQNCGVHVHHDMEDIYSQEHNIQDIAKAFYSIQEPLYALCHKERSSNDFCEKLNFSGENVNTGGRGGFNLHTRHNTVEFRMREGLIDPKAIVRWVRLTKSIVEEIRKLYKDETIRIKKDIREGFDKIFDAIILEKSLQYKEKKDIGSMSLEETSKALRMSKLLLGDGNGL